MNSPHCASGFCILQKLYFPFCSTMYVENPGTCFKIRCSFGELNECKGQQFSVRPRLLQGQELQNIAGYVDWPVLFRRTTKICFWWRGYLCVGHRRSVLNYYTSWNSVWNLTSNSDIECNSVFAWRCYMSFSFLLLSLAAARSSFGAERILIFCFVYFLVWGTILLIKGYCLILGIVKIWLRLWAAMKLRPAVCHGPSSPGLLIAGNLKSFL